MKFSVAIVVLSLAARRVTLHRWFQALTSKLLRCLPSGLLIPSRAAICIRCRT